MSEKNKHVVFKGQIAADASADTVKEKLASLFKVNITQAEAMMSGKPVYIKKNVDQETAQKYQAAMAKAGAIAVIVAPEQAAAPAASSTAAQTGKTASSGVTLPGNSASSDIPDTEAPQTVVQIDTANVDTSAMSMAETGAELQNSIEEVAEPVVDLSGLSLSAAGEGNLSHNTDTPELEIDTGDLSLE